MLSDFVEVMQGMLTSVGRPFFFFGWVDIYFPPLFFFGRSTKLAIFFHAAFVASSFFFAPGHLVG